MLESIYKTQEEIPEPYRELYSERNGQFELTGVNGVKTQADVDRVNVGLTKERELHKETKAKLKTYLDLGDPEDVQAKLDKYPELEAAAEGKIDDAKINEMVEGRVRTKVAPLEREIGKLKESITERDQTIDTFKSEKRQRTIHDEVRKALVEGKVLDVAHEDALSLAERVFEVREDDGAIVTKDNVGITPGLAAKDWLAEIQTKRPHWWAPSQGGGSGGGGPGVGVNGGKNPWSRENWNMTQQGALVRQLGPEKAENLAKQAGSSIGAVAPPAEKK